MVVCRLGSQWSLLLSQIRQFTAMPWCPLQNMELPGGCIPSAASLRYPGLSLMEVAKHKFSCCLNSKKEWESCAVAFLLYWKIRLKCSFLFGLMMLCCFSQRSLMCLQWLPDKSCEPCHPLYDLWLQLFRICWGLDLICLFGGSLQFHTNVTWEKFPERRFSLNWRVSSPSRFCEIWSSLHGFHCWEECNLEHLKPCKQYSVLY